MKRPIVRIDESRCDGCGVCVTGCAEGALRIVDGKARLVGENYCDGLGACLGECPRQALSVEEREAPVFTGPAPAAASSGHAGHGGGCPGSRTLRWDGDARPADPAPSALTHWPVQLALVSPDVPHWAHRDLVLAADCVAYACGGFHSAWLQRKTLAVACPKLDDRHAEYVEKIAALVDRGQAASITAMIMQVPCCRGLMEMVGEALARSRRQVPVTEVIVGLQGQILSLRRLNGAAAV